MLNVLSKVGKLNLKYLKYQNMSIKPIWFARCVSVVQVKYIPKQQHCLGTWTSTKKWIWRVEVLYQTFSGTFFSKCCLKHGLCVWCGTHAVFMTLLGMVGAKAVPEDGLLWGPPQYCTLISQQCEDIRGLHVVMWMPNYTTDRMAKDITWLERRSCTVYLPTCKSNTRLLISFAKKYIHYL